MNFFNSFFKNSQENEIVKAKSVNEKLENNYSKLNQTEIDPNSSSFDSSVEQSYVEINEITPLKNEIKFENISISEKVIEGEKSKNLFLNLFETEDIENKEYTSNIEEKQESNISNEIINSKNAKEENSEMIKINKHKDFDEVINLQSNYLNRKRNKIIVNSNPINRSLIRDTEEIINYSNEFESIKNYKYINDLIVKKKGNEFVSNIYSFLNTKHDIYQKINKNLDIGFKTIYNNREKSNFVLMKGFISINQNFNLLRKLLKNSKLFKSFQIFSKKINTLHYLKKISIKQFMTEDYKTNQLKIILGKKEEKEILNSNFIFKTSSQEGISFPGIEMNFKSIFIYCIISNSTNQSINLLSKKLYDLFISKQENNQFILENSCLKLEFYNYKEEKPKFWNIYKKNDERLLDNNLNEYYILKSENNNPNSADDKNKSILNKCIIF